MLGMRERRKLDGRVVVITGASSGVGRAAALEFARCGARLALAARAAGPLEEAAGECRRAGAPCIAVPTDVADEEAVRALARRTVDEFGGIDVWVNNAAVTLFAPFEEAPPDVYRRVIDVNLMGYVHGARAALPHFRARGGGVLINVTSALGRMGQKSTSAYVTSKFGIMGFSESLRQELLGENIHVGTVLPAAIDTPLFQHGANYTGRTPRPMKPVYSPEMVARAIVGAAARPRREVFAGAAAPAALRTLAPAALDRIVVRHVEREHFMDCPAAEGAGNVFEPMPELDAVHGGWQSDGHWRAGRLAFAVGLTLGLGLALALPALARRSPRVSCSVSVCPEKGTGTRNVVG